MTNDLPSKILDALIDRWENDDTKSVAESRQESAGVIRGVVQPVIDDLERRLGIARGALRNSAGRRHAADCDVLTAFDEPSAPHATDACQEALEALAQLGAPTPTEGSWDWALAQMKAGKRVQRKLWHHANAIYIERCDFRWWDEAIKGTFSTALSDLEATDWRIADGEKAE